MYISIFVYLHGAEGVAGAAADEANFWFMRKNKQLSDNRDGQQDRVKAIDKAHKRRAVAATTSSLLQICFWHPHADSGIPLYPDPYPDV